MLKAVTIEFHSYDELFALFTCRHLYEMSSRRKVSIREQLELNRRFAKGYMMIRQDPNYQEIYKKLLQFAKFVQLTGVPVRKEDYYGSRFIDFFKFVIYLEKCILRSIIVHFSSSRPFQVSLSWDPPPPSSSGCPNGNASSASRAARLSSTATMWWVPTRSCSAQSSCPSHVRVTLYSSTSY